MAIASMRAIVSIMIRNKLEEAIKSGLITGRESVKEQLKKIGLDNKNRGMDPKRYLAIEDFPSCFKHATSCCQI